MNENVFLYIEVSLYCLSFWEGGGEEEGLSNGNGRTFMWQGTIYLRVDDQPHQEFPFYFCMRKKERKKE